ncbi:MAG: transglutaminase-like cysteine peptidase [Planctomycetes bacterium]|nr:transglutaminase-like cysteine peptidase [Planctomycetota bacterium]
MKHLATALLVTILATAAHADELEHFPKWKHVVEHEQAMPKPFAGELKPALDAIQKHYRAIPYVEDFKNYGVVDHWATRAEMRAKGSGDCEDFAIAEYFDLAEAGIPEHDLWIMVVIVKATQELHAVLKVGPWVLDRRAPEVLDARRFADLYTPVFRINRTGWAGADGSGGRFNLTR